MSNPRWTDDEMRETLDASAEKSRQITRLRAEVSELNSMFDGRWSADMRAIECWRKVNPGNELVLPDHVDLSLWLMEERTRLYAEVEKLRADIAYADKHAAKVESLLWGTAKEREKLRAALRQIAGIDVWDNSEQGYVDKARAALEEK